MSRLGKKPVPIPPGVTVTVSGSSISVKGPKGELSQTFPDCITMTVDGSQVQVQRTREDDQAKAMHGTARSLIMNMMIGVTQGYTKELEIEGVGYKVNLQGKKLVMSLGFSHPVEYTIPDGVKVTVTEGTKITVTGCDKHLVGEVAARIRAYHPPEPYKGKGIRLKGEYVRRKAGKTVT